MDPAAIAPSRLRTKAIVAVCVTGIVVGIHLLSQDVITGGDFRRGKPLASVEEAGEGVKRKPSGTYLWTAARTGDALYRRDTVRVGESGFALLRMPDGTKLELGPESLVVIDDLAAASVQFVRGSFILRGKAGDTAITVARGKTESRTLDVRLLEPSPGARHYHEKAAAARIAFAWQWRGQSAPPADLLIELSQNPSFKGDMRRIAAGIAAGATAEVTTGRFFWRLATAGKAVSPVRSLEVVEVSPLAPLSPSRGERVVAWGKGARQGFRWIPSRISRGVGAPPGEHRLEVATDTRFAEPVVSQTVDPVSGSALVDGLPDGPLFWRLISEFDGARIASTIVPFQHSRASEIEISLTLPKDGARLEARPDLPFEWNGASREVEYQLEIDTGGRASIRLRGTETGARWLNPQQGVLSWRVVALKENQIVGASPRRRLVLDPAHPLAVTAPADGQRFLVWTDPSAVRFAWDAAENVREPAYQLKLSTDPALGRGNRILLSQQTEIAPKDWKLGPGEYYWKVDVVEEGWRVVKSSRVSRFLVAHFPPLPPPRLLGAPNQVYFLGDREEALPSIGWDEVAAAKGYEVRLTRDNRLVRRELIEGRKLALGELATGSYRWEVRTQDPLGRLGEPSKPGTFSVDFGARLDAPEDTDWEVE